MALGLLLTRFGTVLVQETEQLTGGVLVEGVVELVESRRDLEALVEHDLLALQADVFGPLHEVGEVALGLHIAA